MPEHDHFPLASPLRALLTRRGLLVSTGAGAITIALGRSVAGHGDDDQTDDHEDDHDDDSGRGRGQGGDDDEIQPSGTISAGSSEVRIDDDDEDAFQPGTITIDLGQSVTWVNVDDDPHTATGAGFDTGRIDPGELATISFDQPGTFPYSCQYHPVMTGTVEVRDESGRVPSRSASSPQASPAASPAASPQASPQAGADLPAEIAIQDFAFDPAEVEIRAGSAVRWTNRDASPHTATSTSDHFDSGTLDEGATFEHTFNDTGTYEYICAFHPNMQGRIVVTS